jgi:hypothetical protein
MKIDITSLRNAEARSLRMKDRSPLRAAPRLGSAQLFGLRIRLFVVS